MKILVSVRVPSLDKKYDVSIPDSVPIGEITELLISCVGEMDDSFVASSFPMLILESNITMLDRALTPADYGISRGDRLILI